MTFTSLGDEVAFGSAATVATLTFSTTLLSDVVAGDLIVIFWASNASSLTVSSCSDNGGGGQVYDIASCTPKTGLTLSLGWILCKAKSSNFGTTITVTLSGSSAHVAGTLHAYHASNGNPVLDKQAGAQSDSASPIDTAFTGVLAQPDELGVASWGYRGTTPSGWSQTTPSGWTQPATFGQSGGVSPVVEVPVGYKENIGSTTSINAVSTFTGTITGVHCWILTFTDVALPKRPPFQIVRRVGSGA
jgi:hypothetical protein